MRKILTGLVVALAAGCGGDEGGGEAHANPGPFLLPDGVEVAASGEGLSLSIQGRPLVTLAKKAPFVGRYFEEKSSGLFAIWSFERSGEERFEIGSFQGASRQGDTVEVRYGGQGQVIVRVSPLRTGASLVKVRFSGTEDLRAKGFRSVTLPFACDPASTFYGFGEQYNAAEQRGEAFLLHVTEQGIGREPEKPRAGINGDKHTTYFPMPYFLDARGFGALLRTPYRVYTDLCKTDPEQATFEVMSGEEVELVVFHGPTPLEVIRQLGDEVGRPKAPPAWAYELWMTTQGGRDAVLEQAQAFEAAGLPVRALWVQDWTGKRKNADGGYGVQYRWVADEELYPDLKGMIAGLKQRNYKVLGYANPFIVKGLEHFDEMASQGFLVKKKGATYETISPGGASGHPDFTAPGTRDYVKKSFRFMTDELGFDGWMEDFGEWVPLDAENAGGVNPEAYHNLFPVEWHRCSAESMAESRPDGDYAVFARSGYTGVHRHAQIFWVGDQEATFSPHDGLPTVVPAMLTLGLSGIPFVTHDVAGFSGGPSTKELFLRWTELGAFTPIFRNHDGNKRDENWSWAKDEETKAHFVRFARVHQALIPEIQAAAAEAAQSGKPLVRHLMLAFPGDAGSLPVHDQFLLGDSLLVAPVVVDGQRKRSVYLPPGTWFHVWTGAPFEGGKTVEIDAPIGSPPVFSLGKDRPDLRAIQP